MSLFGSNRDDRRRRNLAEDLANESLSATTTPAPSAAKPAGKGERYTAAGRRENRRHTSDFIPRHGFSLTVWLGSGLAIVAGLLVGFVKLSGEPGDVSGLSVLFDAGRGGSLTCWFSSLLFGLAAAGSVLIYSIRRHRLDDYRGSYRLWLWSAAAWLVMSIDATANLHTPFSAAMVSATGWSMLGGAAWWIGVWGATLAILALRLLLEVRECRTATLGFTMVFSLWGAALATDYGWLAAGEHATLLAMGGRLLGDVFLLFGVAAYGRHVLLDAEGLLKARPAKPKREKKAKKVKAAAATAETKAEPTKNSRIDAAHKSVPQPTSGPLSGRVSRASTSSNTTTANNSSSSSNGSSTSNRYHSYDDQDDADERHSDRRSGSNRYDDEENEEDDSYGGGNRKLSKAERKRMRKQMRRQGRDEEE
jgi:hypothetical protein